MLDVMRSNAKSSLIALVFGAIILTFIFSFGRVPRASARARRRPGRRG